tara:strand:+ start:4925 stop:5758 length:834 start_codon:yes stop_codon:yes gene_type:complete
MNIGIVGQGYVGTAIKTIFEEYYDVYTYDIKELCNCASLSDLVAKTDIIFVCVPTPMNKDGSCNIDIVEDVVKEINFCNMGDKIVAIKSTIPPGTTNKLNTRYKNVTVIFNPEFLTETNSINDFKNQNRIIIGGQRPATTKLRQVYSLVFPNVPIVKTGSKTAEMVKYFTNSFGAVKVSFANEMKEICDKLNIDYDKVVEYSIYDSRIANSWLAVPGPDGKLGFGGSCFPKDINGLIHLAQELGFYPNVLHGAQNTNLRVRPEEDWKELKGRAVVDD